MSIPDPSISTLDTKPAYTIGRRTFLRFAGLGAAGIAAQSLGRAAEPAIQGFERTTDSPENSKGWQAVSDRKIRMGVIGYGVCRFGADFGFQSHPNVEVVAVSDLIPDRCEALAKACRCSKTYPSLEELVKDDRIEAVFIATDAPSHARHCVEALKHGKHVACAVPAVFGSLEEADRLFAEVRSSGRNYMMFETSCFHEDLHAMRSLYRAGELGKVIYTEGEYYHYMEQPIDSYKGWRIGLPPQWYPTHSNAYYAGVTGGSFTAVSCMGFPSEIEHLKPGNNAYKNPFGTEVALFRTSEGGSARMAVSWDTPGFGGEMGRLRSQKGTYYEKFSGPVKQANLRRPPLPPGVSAGGHGGSHGHLAEEFVRSILENRKPLVDVTMALNLTVSGIVAHQSALKDGELLKIPQYRW
jgi:predicted dehydrogenase